jgi:hypothetical protein
LSRYTTSLKPKVFENANHASNSSGANTST